MEQVSCSMVLQVKLAGISLIIETHLVKYPRVLFATDHAKWLKRLQNFGGNYNAKIYEFFSGVVIIFFSELKPTSVFLLFFLHNFDTIFDDNQIIILKV